MSAAFEFEAPLYRWAARVDSWFFVALPEDVADAIDELSPVKGGFGSVPVSVAIGGSEWETSVFPDDGRGTFVLPVKKAVRTRAKVGEGDVVQVWLRVREV
ncbi:DUF1905 domain-containing protein [Spongisporangium articulatum]|uniref:DUF1905 domain-containing protein n=1 Tax=Spongisporangium articulatum TaxID=3362603 RepID=A0ABW8ALZ9_9ACTN